MLCLQPKIKLCEDGFVRLTARDKQVDNIRYLVLLSVLRRGGGPAAGRARSALVLPPDGVTRLVSDTLNLSVAAQRGDGRRTRRGAIVI